MMVSGELEVASPGTGFFTLLIPATGDLPLWVKCALCLPDLHINVWGISPYVLAPKVLAGIARRKAELVRSIVDWGQVG